jgi:hypothetical protein
MNFRKRLLIFSIGIITIGASGQKLSIETKIDTNTIVIGDQISLSYIILKEENAKIKLPVFNQKLVDGIEIIGAPKIDSTIKGSHEQISLTLTITSFDTGIYYIPPQPLVLLNQGNSDTLKSKATYLIVSGVAIDTTKTIRDIKAPERVSLSFREILPYLAVVILILLIGGAILIYFRKRKKDIQELIPDLPAEAAHITALRELDKIKAQKLWQQKQVKEYYTRITYVIRWYISKRFAIPALEQTSDEILDHLKTLKLDQVNFHNLESLLNLADIVKFAKGEPDPNDNVIHLDNAFDFVKKTMEDSSVNEEKPGGEIKTSEIL